MSGCGSIFHEMSLYGAGRCVCGDFVRACVGCLRPMLNPPSDRPLCEFCLADQTVAEYRARLYERSGFRPHHPRRDNPFKCYCGATAREPHCYCDA